MNASRDHDVYVVYKSSLTTINTECKVLMFVTEDPIFADREVKRLNSEMSTTDRYNNSACFKFEKLRMLSRRKTRHPFMRGAREDVFNPDEVEKDGNINFEAPSSVRISANEPTVSVKRPRGRALMNGGYLLSPR